MELFTVQELIAGFIVACVAGYLVGLIIGDLGENDRRIFTKRKRWRIW